MNVHASILGRQRRKAIEYHGRGPFYLIGGHYEGDVALLGQVVVYTMGPRFSHGGIKQLPQTAHSGAHLHEMVPLQSFSRSVPKGANSLSVRFNQMASQPDAHYQVFITPGFDAGHFWVTHKTRKGFKLNFKNGPITDGTVDVMVRRKPIRPQRNRTVRP